MPTQVQTQAQIAANNSAVAKAQTLPELIQILGEVDPALAQRISGFTSLGEAKVWGPTVVAGLMYLSGRFGLGLSDADCGEIAGALGLVVSALLHKYEVRVHLQAQAKGLPVPGANQEALPLVVPTPFPSPSKDLGPQQAQAAQTPCLAPASAGPGPSALASLSDRASVLQAPPQSKS